MDQAKTMITFCYQSWIPTRIRHQLMPKQTCQMHNSGSAHRQTLEDEIGDLQDLGVSNASSGSFGSTGIVSEVYSQEKTSWLLNSLEEEGLRYFDSRRNLTLLEDWRRELTRPREGP
jgi:hypothetical protein